MKFSKKYKSRIGEFDKDYLLPHRTVLAILEDVASRHCDSVGGGIISDSKFGIAWILTDWNVRILRSPEYGEELTASTWVAGKRPSIVWHREFSMENSKGETLIIASAHLALIDRASGTPIRTKPDVFALYAPEPEAEHDLPFYRLRSPESFERKVELSVRKSDIDFNSHVHNTVYMDYAAEIRASSGSDIKGFRIEYKAPVTFGETVTLCSRTNPDTSSETVCVLKPDGTLSTIIEFYTA